jgi:translation initiation factor 1
MPDGRLVYSSSDGDQRGVREPSAAVPLEPPNDGVVRVFREKGGRRGKTVTVVRGIAGADLASTVSDLKRLCGSGGAVKNGALEIQGDHRERVAARLSALGHVVKLAGG